MLRGMPPFLRQSGIPRSFQFSETRSGGTVQQMPGISSASLSASSLWLSRLKCI